VVICWTNHCDEPRKSSDQTYATKRQLDLPSSAKRLTSALRNQLIAASNARVIVENPGEISKRVTLLSEPPAQILEDLRERKLHEHAFCILGGEKNQQRDREIPHFKRGDDAWFDFSITVRELSGQLELLAYNFEIRFPPGMGVPFLRLDLNLPGHHNDTRDLRCHLHPGADDLQVPAPLMTPSELLTLFLEGAQPLADRTRRDFTAFEVSWFEQTHAHALSRRSSG
jgi:hypothetical protein